MKALACEIPAQRDQPLGRYSTADLVRLIGAHPDRPPMSASTIWRILDTDALKPWQHQRWLFPRDPQFAAKAGRVLDLYAGSWDGQPLAPEDCVVSADEKTSIQARVRCHATTPPLPGQPMRVEHEYARGGALAYLAATRVFWIVDNGSSHRGTAAADRLQARYPNLVLVHLPIHASWLNQVELFFSIVQRKVLTPNDFPDLAAVERRLLAFETLYNDTAVPFHWRFTRADLDRRLAQLPDADRPPPPIPEATLPAAA